MAVLKTIVLMHNPAEQLTLDERYEKYTGLYTEFLALDPEIYGYWDSWELSRFQPGYDKVFGRMRITVSRTETDRAYKNTDGDDGDYKTLKADAIPTVEDPYYDPDSKLWMTSLIYPVKEDGKFVGLLGIDFVLDDFRRQVETINHVEGSQVMLISHKDKYIAHPNDSLLGQPIDMMADSSLAVHTLRKLTNASALINEDAQSIACATSVLLPEVNYTWKLLVILPKATIVADANAAFKRSLAIGAGSILVLVLIILWIGNSVTRPILTLARYINASEHNTSEIRMFARRNPELGKIANSIVALNRKIRNITNFARELENGNLDAGFNDNSAGHDELGKVLMSLRTNLKIAGETEKRRKEEEEVRNFENLKVTELSALVRKHTSLSELCRDSLRFVIQSVNANQGCVYLVNKTADDVPYLYPKRCMPGRGNVLPWYLKSKFTPKTGILANVGQIAMRYTWLRCPKIIFKSNPDWVEPCRPRCSLYHLLPTKKWLGY